MEWPCDSESGPDEARERFADEADGDHVRQRREHPTAVELSPGNEDSEPVQYRTGSAPRPVEVVIVTSTVTKAAALRRWGLLAVGRRQAGRCCEAARDAFADREVVFFRDREQPSEWAVPDAQVVGAFAPAIGYLRYLPHDDQQLWDDVTSFVDEQVRRGIGTDYLQWEAKQCMNAEMARETRETPSRGRK